MRVSVIGGGNFGRALCHAVVRNNHDVTLWSRREQTELSSKVRVTQQFADLVEAELIFIAVPSPHIERVCEGLAAHVDGRHFLVHVSRGLIGESLLPISTVLETQTAARRVGVLAGPLTAKMLAADTPGGAVIGTAFCDVREVVSEALEDDSLRVFSTEDVVGVEVASAMAGLMALGAGFALEAGFDPGSIAVFLTRGMIEAVRLGRHLGAEDRTFRGLAGFGDLLSALAGDERPEVELGRALASGLKLSDAVRRTGAHIEGVRIAERVSKFANEIGLEMPISRVMAEVLRGKMAPNEAIAVWMSDTSPSAR